MSGSAGCRELHEPFTRPQPARSAFRSNTFSYSRMTVYNASHLHWEQVMTDPTFFSQSEYGTVIDSTWIIQHNHGPFDRARAPTGPGERVGVSHDHFAPMIKEALGMNVSPFGGDANVAEIAAFRARPGGAAKWERFGRDVLQGYADFTGGAVTQTWRHDNEVVDESLRTPEFWNTADLSGITAKEWAAHSRGEGTHAMVHWEDVREDGTADGQWH